MKLRPWFMSMGVAVQRVDARGNVAVVLLAGWLVLVGCRQVHIEFHALDGSLLSSRKMQVVPIEAQLFQFLFQLAGSTPRSTRAAMNMSPLMPLNRSK